MNLAHIVVMQLIVGYTCVGMFVATALAAVLDMFGVLRLEPRLRVLLRRILIGEIVVVAVGFFAGLLQLNPTFHVDAKLEPQMQQLIRELAEGKDLRQCSENEPCPNLKPLACLTTNDKPAEVAGGKWLWQGAQPSVTPNTTPQIAFGSWSNGECGLSGTGWHAKIGTCGTGRGEGHQRCAAVLVTNSQRR